MYQCFFFFFLQWVLSYIEMNQPWVYMCSPFQSPLPPPSPPDPSRSSQCTRSERLSHASNKENPIKKECQVALLPQKLTLCSLFWLILLEINPEYSLEELLLQLKFQYFGHLMQRIDSLEKILMLGKTEGRRRRGQQRMRWVRQHHRLNGHEFEQTLGDSGEQKSLAICSPCSPKSQI